MGNNPNDISFYEEQCVVNKKQIQKQINVESNS